ncbi:MAG: fatty acid desaturase [Cyclobacteriaceae bacterium]
MSTPVIDRDIIFKINAFAKETPGLSWIYFLSTMLLVVSSLLLAYLTSTLLLGILFSVLSGLLLSRLFVIYHDFRHQAILRNSTIAEMLMTVIGWLLLAPKSIWDESHNHHHDNNSKFSTIVLGSFPLMTKSEYESASRGQRFKYRLMRHPMVIILAYPIVFLISFCLYPFLENPRRYWDCGLAFLIHILIGFCVLTFGNLFYLVLLQTLPYSIVGAMGGYIFYVQHNFPGAKFKLDENWDYFYAAMYSSSYVKMNKVWRWFTANIGYHHIHHINSKIPFYRLPEVMENIVECQKQGDSSLSPHDIVRCLKLKLWDEEKSVLVGF